MVRDRFQDLYVSTDFVPGLWDPEVPGNLFYLCICPSVLSYTVYVTFYTSSRKPCVSFGRCNRMSYSLFIGMTSIGVSG